MKRALLFLLLAACGISDPANESVANVPPVEPSSFHFVYQSSLADWDAILAMSQARTNVLLLAGEQPPQVDHDHWVAYLTYRSAVQPTAADIDQLLADPATAPRFVMLEELHDATSQAYFVALANDMREHYPQWAGRWGAFLSYGNYPVLAAGIDALLRANAVIALELYPTKSAYCASSKTAGGRDVWLADQLAGNATLGRVNWLVARRAHDASESYITPVFGVGDVLLGDTNAAIFMDRIFYVWATRTGHRSMILAANGGPSTYKWQTSAETPGGYGVASAARDQQWAASFQHYSVDGLTTSRLGQVRCP